MGRPTTVNNIVTSPLIVVHEIIRPKQIKGLVTTLCASDMYPSGTSKYMYCNKKYATQMHVKAIKLNFVILNLILV